MHELTEGFVSYCKKILTFEDTTYPPYQSLPTCIIDCIYSLYTKYEPTTIPIVNHFANHYLNGDRYRGGVTISAFIDKLETEGLDYFRDEVVKNHQILGGVPKEKICLKIAHYLQCLNIETVEDFKNFKYLELLEVVLLSVKGFGEAGVNYLFMLAGDENRCKPDRHVHHSIKDSCGHDVSHEECQIIFSEATKILKQQYPYLTVSKLDGLIWQYYKELSKTKKK